MPWLATLKKHWFLAGMAVALAVALSQPSWGAPGGAVHSQTWVWLATPAIFLISGLLLPTSALANAARSWRLHVFVQGFSLAFCPLLFGAGAALGWLLGLPPALCLGLAVLGCLPTTITSGVAFTRASGGDEAAALVSAALGNLAGLAVTPALMLVLGRGTSGVALGHIVVALLWQMVAPVVVGQVVQLFVGAWAQRRRVLLGNLNSLLLLAIIWTAFSGASAKGFGASAMAVTLAAVLCAALHAAAIAAAFAASAWRWIGLERPTRVAATICATQKTAAMGVPLLTLCFAKDPRLALLTLPLLVYHPLQLVVAGAMASWWRRWSGSEEAAAAA
jgi:sodium/bile acid cotransporter 7